MKLTIAVRVNQYRTALKDWLKRDGLNGKGGPWIKESRQYGVQTEPKPEMEQDTFEQKIFSNIKAELTKLKEAGAL